MAFGQLLQQLWQPHPMETFLRVLRFNVHRERTAPFPSSIQLPNRIKSNNFRLISLRGPDAPAATKKLGQIQLRSKTGRVTLQKELAGYFTSAQAFAFSFFVPSGEKNEVTQMLDKIIPGAGTLSFCVLTETAMKICSDFIVKDSEKIIAETVKPCL